MRTLLFTLALSAIVSCSNKPKEVENIAPGAPPANTSASIEAKQLAAEEEAHAVAEIIFKKGSSNLNADAQKKLKDIIKSSTTGSRKVDEIKLITWSDEEYPDEEKGELSQGQQILVRQRNARLKNFIKKLNQDLEVDAISMAERPKRIAELWGEGDARMKKSLESAGISSTENPSKGTTKASRSIVLILLEPAKK
jgi:hypothetical protein